MTIVKNLIADQFGSHIGKYSERLRVTHGGETLAQAPLIHLESVSILSSGVSISADALEACCERGIPTYFIDSRGVPYASVYASGLTGTIITRREQLRAYDDKRGVDLALAFAAGKIQNQAITLKYLAKNRMDTPEGPILQGCSVEVLEHTAWIDKLKGADQVEEIRERLMGAEGNAAQVYWQGVRLILPQHYGWTSREGRGATDPINSLLNYGYGILYGQIERAIVLAGLDPFAGYIHADRPGKPSLVLDLIEEFRQVGVDRVVFGLVNRDFKVSQDERFRLSEDTRRSFAAHILEHFESPVRYNQQKVPLRHAIQTQAREVAAFVRGDREAYVPFKAGW